MLYLPCPSTFCPKCGREYPQTTEFFRFYRDRNKLHRACRDCDRVRDNLYHEKNREKARESNRRYYANNRAAMQKRGIDYREANRERIIERERQRYHTVLKKDKVYATNKRNKARIYGDAHPEARKERAKKWREEHKDEQKERRRRSYEKRKNDHVYIQRQREYQRKRQQDHPELVKANNQRRRARKAGLPSRFTKDDWLKAVEYFGGRCATCGRAPGFWHTLAADHWVPISDPSPDNPGTTRWNIVPLCHGENGCNNSKCNKNPVEWVYEHFGRRRGKVVLKRIQDYFDWVRSQ